MEEPVFDNILYDLPKEILLTIFDWCGPVSLYFLHSTSGTLSGLVDSYVRAAWHQDALFRPKKKVAPQPSEHSISDLLVNSRRKIKLHDIPNFWIEDLFSNLTPQVLTWYKQKIVNNAEVTKYAFRGLHRLLSWKNERTDGELANLLILLEERDCIDRYNKFEYIIESGRLILVEDKRLYQNFFVKKRKVKPRNPTFDSIINSLDDDNMRAMISRAIYSGNPEMLSRVYSSILSARVISRSQDEDLTARHIIAALETSDNMIERLLSLMTHLPLELHMIDYDEVRALGLTRGPQFSGKLPNNIFYYLFCSSGSYGNAFKRVWRYLEKPPSSEELLELFWQSANRESRQSNKVSMDDLQWLKDAKFLSQQAVVQFLQPRLRCSRYQYTRDEQCDCYHHNISNALIELGYGIAPLQPDLNNDDKYVEDSEEDI